MRLFIAIDLPPAIREHLASLQQALAGLKGLRAVNPKNIHLTLNFLGEQPSAETITEQLKTVTFSPFTLTLQETGFFPNKHKPRVVWVGLKDNKELFTLQANIDRLFTPDKSFKAHLTLARIKPGADMEGITSKVEKLVVKPLSFPVDSFKLYKSTLTPLGPIYEVVGTFKAG